MAPVAVFTRLPYTIKGKIKAAVMALRRAVQRYCVLGLYSAGIAIGRGACFERLRAPVGGFSRRGCISVNGKAPARFTGHLRGCNEGIKKAPARAGAGWWVSISA